MRYRDLPAVHFAPPSYRRLDVPGGAKANNLSISPGGQVHWTCFEEGKGSTIFADDGQRIDLHPPGREQFRFPNLQRFPDGRWLVAEARMDPVTPNAFVFDPDGTHINSFYAGDGIQTVLVDRRGKIWIGYFDEGVFGAFNPMPAKEQQTYRFGPSGLVRVDDRGEIEFAYNSSVSDKFISISML
jgi:streptogramin lyase